MIDLSKLNEQQCAAVLYTDGPLLVSAGAGSGKTRVICYKIAHLIYDLGVDPSSILAVTFTNKAAKEMKERVEKLLDVRDMGLTVSTFHSFGARFLRKYAERVGLPAAFTIADVAEQERVFKKAAEAAGIRAPGTARKALSAISRLKEEGLTPDEAMGKASYEDERQAARLYAAYQQALHKLGAADFDDLLLYTVRILQTHPDALAAQRERIGYLLIDEYQDTNWLQFEMARLLTGDGEKGLCAVGDEDQSIYGWRGASVDHIRRFERDFKGSKVILLEQNYRSTGHILAGASKLISRNRDRYEKTLHTTRPVGHPIIHHEADGPDGEVDFVVGELGRLVKEGEVPAAVLYRANHMSRTFEDGLVRSGLKYRIVGSLRFYERKEIKDLTSYLRLLVNPRDRQAFFRAANVPPRKGLGPKSLEAVVEMSHRREIDLVAAAERVPAERIVSAAAAVGLAGLAATVRKLGTEEERVSELLGRVMTLTRYRESVRETDPPDVAEDRLGNVEEFLNAAREFDNEGRGSLLDFLDSISLTTGQDEVETEKAPVLLMTIHCAKGLEFPSVFLVHLNANAFPLPYALYDPTQLEEERRLCYVGMTRAMRNLFLTSNSEAGPSRFLEEIDGSGSMISQEQPIRGAAPSRMPAAPGPTARPRSSHGIRSSARVVHPSFGTGTVLRIDGEGELALATIAFDEHGVKRMALRYAKLTPA